MAENQNIEYKTSWRDEYLKWICGFANAHGGKIFIGIDDNGSIIGLEDYKKLMEEIPNKSVNYLGLVVDVNLHRKEGKHYIEIDVPTSTVPISFHGAYHYRSGSTKQELKGIALQNWLLKKIGKNWEDIPIPTATIGDLDETTVHKFLQMAIKKGRIPAEAANDGIAAIMEKLNLVNSEGHLTNAAILLFGKKPHAVSVTSSFKIGKFGKEPHDLLFQDVIETNLFSMADKVMGKLDDRYLIRPISYAGLERIESLEYPEPALREAVLNAIIHKDYSSTWIFLRVYDDKLEIWNPGTLPEELTIEQLKGIHSSYPRNPNIASVFFKAGYIESWGRGTTKVLDSCRQAQLPEPEMKELQGGFVITFFKNRLSEEQLLQSGLNNRQVKAVFFTRGKGKITNKEYQKLNDCSRNTASNDLSDLVKRSILVANEIKGAGAYYQLK